MRENHGAEDIIEVTMEYLDDEQKKLVEDNVNALVKLCLDSFSKTWGKAIQKSQLSTSSVMVIPADELVGTFGVASYQDTVDRHTSCTDQLV